MQDLKVVLRIDGKTGKVRFEVEKLEEGLKELGESGKKSGDKISQGMNQAEKSTNTAKEVAKGMRNELVRLASVGFAAKLIKDAIGLADEMKLLDARINLVTNSQQEFNFAQQETTRIALETHTAIGTTVQLYTRLERALSSQSVAQAKVLSVTETINKALAVSGATAQETSSVITQLSQGLAAGALRGEEFNAVSESGSRIMQILKDELGKTSGQLREMAFAGELTTEIITKALLNQSKTIADEFGKLPVTIDKAFVDLRTNFALYAKDIDESVNITGALSSSVKFLGDNLETIIDTLGHALVFYGLYRTANLLFIADIGKATLATRLYSSAVSLATGKIGLMAAASRGLSAALKANPIALGVTALYLAYEGVNAILDDHNEKLEELSVQSDTAAKSIKSIQDEFAKGFDADFSNITNDIDTLNNELNQLVVNYARTQAELSNKINSGGAQSVGFDIAKNLLSGNGFNTSDQLAYEAKKKEIEATKLLATANEFLTDTFGPLIAESQRLTDIENARTQSINDNKAAVDDWITSQEKQLEKLTKENEIYGLNAIEIIELDAKKQRALTTDATQLKLINEITKSLIAETKQKSALKKATADELASKKLENELLKQSIILSQQKYDIVQDIIDSVATPQESLDTQYENEINAINERLELLVLSVDQYELLIKTKEKLTETYKESTEELIKEKKELEDLEQIKLDDMFDGFAEGINPAIGALQSFRDEIATINELMESGALTKGQQAFYSTGISAEFALNSMANMAQEGSDAQKKLQAAAAITNTILGITAILEQGKGDPYTAFARMAAMAAMVASLGVQVAGAFGGGGSSGAERQQEIQGTGTVLGDATAKSESISNSLDLIASASEKIVGINSKMLRSLNTMNNAIAGTVTEIGKLGTIGDFGTTAPGFGGLTGAIDSLVFGGSKVIDRGIDILAGGISDAINGDLFQAYETAKKSGLFGSSTRTNTGALAGGITNQIGLIFQSMTDSILAGAEALGLDLGDIQNALDSYQIEAQKISLLDLDPDEQRAELEAVFSSIFDGMTAYAIPFITQFQQAGEGLGETLARVATTVLVFEEAIESMGLDFIAKELDPELFAQAAVAISDFAGGMEEFIDGYTSYVSNFLSEAEQMDILEGRIEGIFADLDIKLPDSREAFKKLIQSLDLTTLAGQEAFGILISLSSEMDSFYDGLEKIEKEQIQIERERLDAIRELKAAAREAAEALRLANEEYKNYAQSIRDEIGAFDQSDFISTIAQIRQAELDRIATLNELAIAAGKAGANEKDLMNVHILSSLQIAKAVANLKTLIASIQDELYGDQLETRIAELEALEGIQLGGISSVANASDNLFDDWKRAIDNLRSYTQSLLIGDYSPLEADDRLDQALSNFFDAVDAANNGDIDAANSLPGLADIVLGLNDLVNASGSDYNDIFYSIYEALNGVDAPGGLSQQIDGTYTVTPSAELQSLYNELEARNAAGEAENRLQLATQLAQHLNELALAVNQPLFDIAAEIGLSMTDLVADLGVNLDDLTAASVQNLANIANLLGVELSELAENLGEDVSGALGELADAQSLLNDALEGTINTLPPEFADLLTPLLQDIENAADGKAQERALQALINATSNLPAEYRNLLAPFFDDIDVTTEMQLQSDYMQEQIDWLHDIHDILNGTLKLNPANDPIFDTAIQIQTLELETQTGILREIRDNLINPVDSPRPVAPVNAPGDYVNSTLINTGVRQTSSGNFLTNTNSTQKLENKLDEVVKQLADVKIKLDKANIINDEISENTENIKETNNRISRQKQAVSGNRTVSKKGVYK